MLPKGTLGPGIIGQEQFERELQQTTKGAQMFGPGILGEPEPEPEPVELAPSPEDPDAFFPSLSVEKLRDTLAGNEHFLDLALESELKREPGPRKSALRLFLEYERSGQDRQEVLQRLEEALE